MHSRDGERQRPPFLGRDFPHLAPQVLHADIEVRLQIDQSLGYQQVSTTMSWGVRKRVGRPVRGRLAGGDCRSDASDRLRYHL